MDTENQRLLVSFWGTRGSIPIPGRMTEKYGGNTACVSVRSGNQIVVFDAGTGIRNLGLQLASDLTADKSNLSINLFLSHVHWDHVQGLPFFQPLLYDDLDISIYCVPENKDKLQALFSADYFPRKISSFPANLNYQLLSTPGPIEIGNLVVNWERQGFHPGGSLRFRVEAGKKKIIYASDVELDAFLSSQEQAESEEAERYLEFIQGADLLIADGQFDDEDYFIKQDWGHTSVTMLLETANRAGVKTTAVFHHDPQYTDDYLDELYMKYTRRYLTAAVPMEIYWAREGVTIAV